MKLMWFSTSREYFPTNPNFKLCEFSYINIFTNSSYYTHLNLARDEEFGILNLDKVKTTILLNFEDQ